MCDLVDYQGCSPKLAQYTKESLMLIGGVGLGLCCVQVSIYSRNSASPVPQLLIAFLKILLRW